MSFRSAGAKTAKQDSFVWTRANGTIDAYGNDLGWKRIPVGSLQISSNVLLNFIPRFDNTANGYYLELIG